MGIEDRDAGSERRGLEAVGLGRLTRIEPSLWVAGGGFLLAAVGIFGPFSEDPFDSFSGIAGDDGKFLLAVAAIGLIVLWRAIDSKGGPELLLAIGAALVILVDGARIWRDVEQLDEQARTMFGEIPEGYETLGPGWGLFVMVAGAAVALIGCGLTLYLRMNAARPAAD